MTRQETVCRRGTVTEKDRLSVCGRVDLYFKRAALYRLVCTLQETNKTNMRVIREVERERTL